MLLCADRSNTRRRGALFGRMSGQDAVGVFVHTERCRSGDARPARLSRRGGEGLSRYLCNGRQRQQASGSRGGRGGGQCALHSGSRGGVDITENALRKSRRAVRGQHRTPAEESGLTATPYGPATFQKSDASLGQISGRGEENLRT